MANEQIEEITPGSGSGGSPLIPALAVLVLMPVLSFVLTKFIFIPQIQTAVTEAVVQAGGGELQFEAAGQGASVNDDAHGGGHGAAAIPRGPSGTTYEFENIIANLSGSSMNRYVKVSFVLEGNNSDFASIIDANRVKLIDATITVLSSLSSLDLQSAGVKNEVRSKLMAAYDSVLKSRIVEGLYFSEFVMQ